VAPLASATLLLMASNVFMTFAYLWAALCILTAVYFVFRSPATT
jgi:uncharacterized protein (DUF486 family)